MSQGTIKSQQRERSAAAAVGAQNRHSAPFFEHFGIVLDNAEGVYFAGQEIVGKVVIECREPRRVSELLLEVKGRARTHWTKSRKTCSANEAYFCEQFNTEYTRKLPKAEDYEQQQRRERGGAERTAAERRKDSIKLMGRTLHAGTHEIPFSYVLPKNLPNSFEGEFGFVRYTCRAVCESPWDFDTVCFLPFTVVGIEDLNCEAELLSLPLETRCSHSVGAFCVRLGSVSTELRIARGGFTPGESVRVNAKVRNESRRTLRGSKTFAGAEQQRTTTNVVQTVRAKNVPSGGEFECSAMPLTVPSVPPRLTPKCRLIDVTYCVELSCRTPPFCVSLPVVIGTIPLLPPNLRNTIGQKVLNNGTPFGRADDESGGEKEEDNLDSETERNCASKKRVRMPSSVLSELYPALPTPCFRELHSGPVKVADERERKFQFGPNLFTPKHPFYVDGVF
uniref:Arrestin C-terminal-like domain-containing protein n=1 Tax=Globodera rostochiensis TaxID=31243 RepID=A0A914I6J9_GLORO